MHLITSSLNILLAVFNKRNHFFQRKSFNFQEHYVSGPPPPMSLGHSVYLCMDTPAEILPLYRSVSENVKKNLEYFSEFWKSLNKKLQKLSTLVLKHSCYCLCKWPCFIYCFFVSVISYQVTNGWTRLMNTLELAAESFLRTTSVDHMANTWKEDEKLLTQATLLLQCEWN